MKRAATLILALLLLASSALVLQSVARSAVATVDTDAPPTAPPLVGVPTSGAPPPAGPPTAPVPPIPGVPAIPPQSPPTAPPLVGAPTFAVPTPPAPPPLPPTQSAITPATGTPSGSTAPAGAGIATATATATATGPATATACPTITATGTPTSTATACATATIAAPAAPTAPTACGATAAPAASPLSPAAATTDMPGLRGRTTRTFALGGDKYQQMIAQGSLNYQDAQGAWQPIDNTLVAATTPGYAYRNKANGYTASFPADLAANPVSVGAGGRSVSFALVGATGTGATCNNQVTYANALPGVTVGYAAGSDAVTEALTLASAAAPAAYTYTVQASAGLTPRTNNTGGIDFVDTAGKVAFAFAPPTMHDSAKQRAQGNVSLRLATAGRTTVTLAADPAWLADPARVYPVVIDPDVTLPAPTASCILKDAAPTLTTCDAAEVGHTTYGTSHTVMKFDTSGFNSNFVITAATVTLSLVDAYTHDQLSYITDIPPMPTEAISVHRMIVDSWDPACVSWNDRGCNTPWDQHPGGVIDTSDGSTIAVPSDCGSTTGCVWDVKNMMQAWINGSQPNDGMLFDDDNGHINDDVYYAFSGPHTASPPFLTITYQGVPAGGTIKPDLGSRPFYTIAGSQLDDRMSVGVNAASGNLLVEATDVSLPGIGMDFAVTRSYNSRGIYRGAFGDHWSMDGGADLWLNIYPNGDVVLQGTTGFQTGFVKSGASWIKPNGLDADLTSAGAPYAYQLQYHAAKTSYLFDGSGRLLRIQDRNGNHIDYAYSGGTRQVTTATDTEGRVIAFTYNASGVVAAIAITGDPMGGRRWQYFYDDAGHPTWLTRVVEYVTGATTRTTSFAYDGATGNLASITDPRGKVTGFQYDANAARGKLTALTRAGLTTSFAYSDPTGDGAGTTTISDATPAHNPTTLTYDANGEITRATDAAGNHADYAYNANRKITSITDALVHTTTYTYAADNERLTDTTLPTGAHTHTAYADAQGCPYQPYQVTDAQGQVVQSAYDAACNRTQTIGDPGGLHLTTTTTYNANGTVASVQDARGHTTTLSYTFTGAQLTQVVAHAPAVTSGTGLGDATTVYDAVGRRQSATDGKGQTTTYTYDYLDRPLSVTYAGADAVQYAYDPDGNLTSRAEGAGTTTFTYDDLNRPVSKHLPTGPYAASGNSAEMTYDAVGDLLTLGDAGGVVTYHYDARHLLDTLTEPNGAVTSFGYDANGSHTLTTYPGGTTLALSYDAAGRLGTIQGAQASGNWLTRSTYSYLSGTADTGLRQSVIDSVANTTTSYSYDAVNRLTVAHTVTTGTSTQTADYQYGYDANGNRVSTVIGGAGTSATFNEVDEQVSWNTGQTRTYTYDVDGNETGSSANEGRTYNSRNQTVAITGLNGIPTGMGYLDSGQGERVAAGGSTYVNDSLGVASETKGGQTTYYTRTPGGHLVSQRTPTATYYYLFDGLGSVVGLVDQFGNVAARYGYDPYGQEIVKHGPDNNPGYLTIADGNPFRYTGAYLDSTGLYKLGERYYDPARGRFTQLDPLGDGYVYTKDNPVNGLDPSGLACVDCGAEEGEGGGGSGGGSVGGIGGPSVDEIIDAEIDTVAATSDESGGLLGPNVPWDGKPGGPITGYTDHGWIQSYQRDGGNGVSTSRIESIVDNATPKPGRDNTVVYNTGEGRVVLNPKGEIVTAISYDSRGYRWPR